MSGDPAGIRDTAGSLDAHFGADDAAHQSDVLDSGTTLGESGARFDKMCTGSL